MITSILKCKDNVGNHGMETVQVGDPFSVLAQILAHKLSNPAENPHSSKECLPNKTLCALFTRRRAAAFRKMSSRELFMELGNDRLRFSDGMEKGAKECVLFENSGEEDL